MHQVNGQGLALLKTNPEPLFSLLPFATFCPGRAAVSLLPVASGDMKLTDPRVDPTPVVHLQAAAAEKGVIWTHHVRFTVLRVGGYGAGLDTTATATGPTYPSQLLRRPRHSRQR